MVILDYRYNSTENHPLDQISKIVGHEAKRSL